MAVETPMAQLSCEQRFLSTLVGRHVNVLFSSAAVGDVINPLNPQERYPVSIITYYGILLDSDWNTILLQDSDGLPNLIYKKDIRTITPSTNEVMPSVDGAEMFQVVTPGSVG
jgi:sRNA-binding regulator protein Hfq